jgi:hypothetical protein
MRIAVKYCGNCNPEINSPRIIDRWMKTLEDDEIIFHPEGKTVADLLIIICGCRKACVDRREIRAMGRQVLVIKGRWMNGLSLSENELAHQLLQRAESAKAEIRSPH